MTEIVSNQRLELKKMDRQIGEIEHTEQGMLPLMQQMLDALEQFVQLDLPFLPEERATRLVNLKALMVRGDVSVSEKYRRVLEAYQIEVEYGRTLEAYRQQARTQNDSNKVYDFLRIGRTALYRLSLQGNEAWRFDAIQRQWQILPNSALRDLRKALNVANQTAAPELLVLPLPTFNPKANNSKANATADQEASS